MTQLDKQDILVEADPNIDPEHLAHLPNQKETPDEEV